MEEDNRDAGLALASGLRHNTALTDLVLGDVSLDADVGECIGATLTTNKIVHHFGTPAFVERLTDADGLSVADVALVREGLRAHRPLDPAARAAQVPALVRGIDGTDMAGVTGAVLWES